MIERLSRFRSRSEKKRTAPPQPSSPQPVAPRLLAEQLLKRLEFKVLRRLDGMLFGSYSGPFYGPSLDLAEVREYQPGDEVRHIDWQVTARTGTVHVRQYREEREVSAWLIVDLSPSMAFGTRRSLKRDQALEFVGVAASILTRRGNKVGALGFSGDAAGFTPLSTGRHQPLTLLHNLTALANTTAETPETPRELSGIADLGDALAHLNRRLKRRSLVFVVSDFLASENLGASPSWDRELSQLSSRHDTVAVRVSDPAEHNLPAVGKLRFRDPESGAERWLDTSDPRVRAAHAELVATREQSLEQSFRRSRVDVLTLSTAEDLVTPLLAFRRRQVRQR